MPPDNAHKLRCSWLNGNTSLFQLDLTRHGNLSVHSHILGKPDNEHDLVPSARRHCGCNSARVHVKEDQTYLNSRLSEPVQFLQIHVVGRGAVEQTGHSDEPHRLIPTGSAPVPAGR